MDITSAPTLPYVSGCIHASPCMNVYAGRACALDTSRQNGFDELGRATVTSEGQTALAQDPYADRLSGRRY